MFLADQKEEVMIKYHKTEILKVYKGSSNQITKRERHF